MQSISYTEFKEASLKDMNTWLIKTLRTREEAARKAKGK